MPRIEATVRSQPLGPRSDASLTRRVNTGFLKILLWTTNESVHDDTRV